MPASGLLCLGGVWNRAKGFQGSEVNCFPEGCPFLFNTFKIRLEVLDFVVQV